MALVKSEMILMAYTGATPNPNHVYWYSNTEEDDVLGAGYFNGLANQLKVEDLIYDVESAWFYRVSEISGAGVVTVAALAEPT